MFYPDVKFVSVSPNVNVSALLSNSGASCSDWRRLTDSRASANYLVEIDVDADADFILLKN